MPARSQEKCQTSSANMCSNQEFLWTLNQAKLVSELVISRATRWQAALWCILFYFRPSCHVDTKSFSHTFYSAPCRMKPYTFRAFENHIQSCVIVYFCIKTDNCLFHFSHLLIMKRNRTAATGQKAFYSPDISEKPRFNWIIIHSWTWSSTAAEAVNRPTRWNWRERSFNFLLQ